MYRMTYDQSFIDESTQDFLQILYRGATYLTTSGGGARVTYEWSYTDIQEHAVWMSLTCLHHPDIMEQLNCGIWGVPPAVEMFRSRGAFTTPDGLVAVAGVYHLRDSSLDEKYLISLTMPRGADCVVALTFRPRNDPFRGWTLRAKEAYFLDHASIAMHETCKKGTENTVPFFHLYVHGSHVLRCLLAARGFDATPLDDELWQLVPQETQRRMERAWVPFDTTVSDLGDADDLEAVE